MMIEHPLADLDSWVGYFSRAELPVLRHTKLEIEKMRANAENTDGRILSALILQDPLMTLRVLAFLEQHRGKNQNADITTIGRALMMIGVNPFFSAFGPAKGSPEGPARPAQGHHPHPQGRPLGARLGDFPS
jgi:hypothetical protein